jgi:hypothetical protein
MRQSRDIASGFDPTSALTCAFVNRRRPGAHGNLPTMPIKSNAKEAKFGEKMIDVKVCFWTDDLSGDKRKVIPKHAWTSGVVCVERNETHGIKPSARIPFNSLLDLGSSIEKAFIKHGVVLHPGRKMKKYISLVESEL